MDLDEHLPAFERRHFDFIDDQRLALLDQNGGGRFQTVLTTDYTDYTNRFRPNKHGDTGKIVTTDYTDITDGFSAHTSKTVAWDLSPQYQWDPCNQRLIPI